MFDWFLSHRRFCFSVLIILCVSFVSAFLHYKKTYSDINEGWKTTKQFNEPFRGSVIINGHNPASFVITLIQPINDINVKFSTTTNIPVKVQVKFSDKTSLNSDIAPTSVVAYIRDGKLFSKRIVLDPFERKDLTYVYEGTIENPIPFGRYRLEIEVNYSIYDLETNDPVRPSVSVTGPPRRYKRLLEGTKINVGN